MWGVSNHVLLKKLVKIEGMLFRLMKPVLPRILCTGERVEGMKKFMQYEVTVAAVPSGIDAVEQTLVVTSGDVNVLDTTLPVGGGIEAFEGLVGTEVKAELSYADEAGNDTLVPAVVVFTVVDVIAPPTPDTDVMAFTCTGERVEEDAEPEPEPVPETD